MFEYMYCKFEKNAKSVGVQITREEMVRLWGFPIVELTENKAMNQQNGIFSFGEYVVKYFED